jgi:hypothetical protein
MQLKLTKPDRPRRQRIQDLANTVFLHTKEGIELMELMIEEYVMRPVIVELDPYMIGKREGKNDMIRELYTLAISMEDKSITEVKTYDSN